MGLFQIINTQLSLNKRLAYDVNNNDKLRSDVFIMMEGMECNIFTITLHNMRGNLAKQKLLVSFGLLLVLFYAHNVSQVAKLKGVQDTRLQTQHFFLDVQD